MLDTYKVLVLGCGGSGKTSFINTINGCKFVGRYTPTSKLTEYTIRIDGKDVILYDMPGQYLLHSNIDIPKDIDVVIAMYDSTSNISRDNMYVITNSLLKVLPHVHIVYVASKIDIQSNHIPNTDTLQISSRTGCGCMDVIKYITNI